MINFDIALIEKEVERGLSRTEIIDLTDFFEYQEMLPIEIEGDNSSAMGFISRNYAEKIDYDYEKSGLNQFIANILNDKSLESNDCTYNFVGGYIYLTRNG